MTVVGGGRVQLGEEEEVELLVGNCRMFTVALWLYPVHFSLLIEAVEHMNCHSVPSHSVKIRTSPNLS